MTDPSPPPAAEIRSELEKKKLGKIVDDNYAKIESFTHSTIYGALGAVATAAFSLGAQTARDEAVPYQPSSPLWPLVVEDVAAFGGARPEPVLCDQPADPFAKGARVRLTEEGRRQFARRSMPLTGVVTGKGRRRGLVRVLRDGYATPTSYAKVFWEPLPPAEAVQA